jgi:hypothetical protein
MYGEEFKHCTVLCRPNVPKAWENTAGVSNEPYRRKI